MNPYKEKTNLNRKKSFLTCMLFLRSYCTKDEKDKHIETAKPDIWQIISHGYEYKIWNLLSTN